MESERSPSSLAARLREVASLLDAQFLGKREVVRLLLISIVAGEHAVIIGPPGTAKSALLRGLARLLDARYFEYLLTRFTEPNEIFGPVDIAAFRQGTYRRRTAGMLPEAEIVFLDEVFKSNSAILNTLLTLLNERRFTSGGEVIECPLVSVFGASNEVPGEEFLEALFDRFLLRVRSDNLDAYHFNDLLECGLAEELRRMQGGTTSPRLNSQDLARLPEKLAPYLELSSELRSAYKSLVFQIRAEGIGLSDRRVVKVLKLIGASAYLDGRPRADQGDLFVLKHIWNSEEQATVLEGIVQPVIDAFFRDNPKRAEASAPQFSIVQLEGEVDRIRRVLTAQSPPTDLQLFAQLRALGEIRTTLAQSVDPRAKDLEGRVKNLLEASLQGTGSMGR